MAVAGSMDADSGLFCNAAGGGAGSGPGSSPVIANSSSNFSGWTEFCERHARAAASDFAKSCVHYVNKNLPENVRTTVSHRDFMMKFIECFSEHFESEFSRRRMHHKVFKILLLVPTYNFGSTCFLRSIYKFKICFNSRLCCFFS